MFGKIQHFRADKLWGFVRVPGLPEDVFFNARVDFEGDYKLLKKGVAIEFDWRIFKGRKIAGNLRIVNAEVTPAGGSFDDRQ